MSKFAKIAAIQMISTPDVAQNMASAATLIADAASQGATLVVLPEYWALMGMKEEDKIAHGESVDGGVIQSFMAGMARQHQVWLIGGTLPMAAAQDKVFNTTLVYNPQGELAARYDKIHLFGFSKGAESYDEARTIVPGCEVAAVDLPLGRVGLSVCYDLRFPELFRALGPCALLVLPAAFTYTTGQAHWEVLLRARAIENQCYLLASAQGGQHVNGRRTFGHSMIIDPWGKVLAVLPEGEGVVVAEIDLDYMQEVRTNLPALKHRKL